MDKVKDMTGSLIGGGSDMLAGLFGGDEQDKLASSAEAEADEKRKATMAFLNNMSTERDQDSENLGLSDFLAGESAGQIETPPDAKTLLAKEAVEEATETGTSVADSETVTDKNVEMLETLKLIAQNGSEQNAKLSAIADASEAGVTVNKKILTTTYV